MNRDRTNTCGRDAFHRVPNLIIPEEGDAVERVPTGFVE